MINQLNLLWKQQWLKEHLTKSLIKSHILNNMRITPILFQTGLTIHNQRVSNSPYTQNDLRLLRQILKIMWSNLISIR